MALGTDCSASVSVPSRVNAWPAFSISNGTFLYCNNPEQLYDQDLGDHAPGYGNHYLLWSRVTGPCQAYYSHSNRTGHPIGYGLQLYNPNSHSVRVTITHSGFSAGEGFETWNQFFSGAAGPGRPVGSFSVAPGSVLWLQQFEAAVPDQTVFSGTVRFEVHDAYAIVFNYAFHRLQAIDGTAGYAGLVTRTEPDGQDEGRVYKGLAAGYFLTNIVEAALGELVQQARVWMTHGCRAKFPDAVATDIRWLVAPTDDIGSAEAFRLISCGNQPPANLANWGVQYLYRLNVRNDTADPGTVHLVVSQPGENGTPTASRVYVATPEGRAGCVIRTDRNPHWAFYRFELAPGETRSVDYQVILAGNSFGGLQNSLIAQ